MLERLLESWLDSASERSYQDPFCQILSAKGHKILHSTRHAALEFGKDILTIGPDGIPCAFQLKGNPGSRLTLNEFRAIQGQLVQMATQPIIYPGIKIQRHRCFLVTNGYVEEEVQRALDDLNRGFLHQETIGLPIELISRGHLLADIVDYGSALWPTELEDINVLLGMLVKDGKQHYPAEMASTLLKETLLLQEDESHKPSANEIKRRITSAALLISISLRNYHIVKNHYGVLCAWVVFASHVYGTINRYKKSFKNNAQEAIEIAAQVIFVSLSDLCDELKERGHLVEGNPLVDAITYRGRYTLVVSLMSIYWFWGNDVGFLKDGQKDYLKEFLPRDFKYHLLWGEGAIPQFLIYIWYLRDTDAGIRPDLMLGFILKQLVNINTQKDQIGLSSPYFTFEDSVRHTLKEFLGAKSSPFDDITFRNSSYFAKAILLLLVRTNLKVTSKSIWPTFSRLSLKHFSPENQWGFCLLRTGKGVNVTDLPKLTKHWKELQQEARDCRCAEAPIEFVENRYILMLFCILFPYRAIPSVVSKLDRYFNGSWFIPEEPIEDL